MASTTTVCEVQAMYVASSRVMCHLHAFMRVSASLRAHDLWIVVIYFWFAKTLRRLHHQLLSPMSFMNLCHLGLTAHCVPPSTGLQWPEELTAHGEAALAFSMDSVIPAIREEHALSHISDNPFSTR